MRNTGLLGVAMAVICVSLLLPVPVVAQANSSGTSLPAEAARFRSYMEEGVQAMRGGDYSSAAAALRQALALNPNSVAALNNLGIALTHQGKVGEAIPLYERALKLQPDPRTQRNLAIAYFKEQRYSPAWRLLSPLAREYPKDFQILDLAGLSLFALDRYPEAARYLERANEAQPTDLETLDMLGKAYLRMKDYKSLTSVFARILQVNPNSASAHMMMATAYAQRDKTQEAIGEYLAAEKADPSFMGVHSGLGSLYLQEHKTDLAEKEFRAELQRYPNDAVANCLLGQILTNSQPAEAAQYFKAALRANPRYRDALFGLGKAEVSLGHPAQAVEPLRQAVGVDPNFVEAHYVLGTALRQLGQTDAAVREQQIALGIQEKRRADYMRKQKSQ